MAGKRAIRAPLYHGALVGAGYVIGEALGIAPGPLGATDGAFADTIAIFVSDLALLAVGSAAGWLAGASFSPGTDRAR